MNKRIKELASKALDQAVPETWTTLTPEQLEKVQEKFAELIVGECLLCCERTISDPVPVSVDTFEEGGIHCMDEIKQHFGVE